MSDLSTIGDGIVSVINAAAITVPAPLTSVLVVAERKNLPIFELATVGDALLCTVVPAPITFEPGTRGKVFRDYAFDIGVQRRIDSTKTTEADAVHTVVEAVADLFAPGPTIGAANWLTTEIEPNAAPEWLEKYRVLTSVITVTYRVLR